MPQYPIEFKANTALTSGINNPWSTQSQGFPPLSLDIPQAFEGKGNGLSPEDLYLLAITNCFAATFKYAAEKSKLAFDKMEIDSTLEVNFNSEKKLVMDKVILQISIFGINDRGRAERLLAKIEGQCLILNSVQTQIIFNYLFL